MNVTYKDLKDGYILKEGDALVIHGIKHSVEGVCSATYYLQCNGATNAIVAARFPKNESNEYIFRVLGIEDKYDFVRQIVGDDVVYGGDFPEVKTLDALSKVAIALLERPLYNVGDYVTVRKEIEGHKYALTYWDTMQEFAGKTSYVTKFEIADSFDNITDGEIYQYKLSCGYWWDFAMLMPATEEEKKSVDVPDKGEPEEKEKEEIHFVTLEDLNGGYIFKKSDHIRINGLDCIIRTIGDGIKFWLSSYTVLEREIYDSLGIPDDKKKELATACGSIDTNFTSPEFPSLECLSAFVRRILMYKKEDEKPSKKKWSGNPTYFDLKNGRILEKDNILNIHGIEYRVTCGVSDGKRCWLHAPGFSNSAIFDKLRIDDKSAFVKGICPTVSTCGDFPEVGSYEDLTKVAIALYEVPEFKVGDKVKVAHREDKEGDYPWYFTDEMLALRDKVFTIKAVAVCGCCFGGKSYDRLRKDPHCYHLDTEGRDFQWHSSMLEKVSESDEKSEESSKDVSFYKPSPISLSDIQLGYTLKDGDIAVLRGDASAGPLSDVIRWERINLTMDASELDKPSDTGNVRLPEIKDDFKIIL